MKQENEYSFLGCAGNVAKIINEFNSNVFLLSCIGKNNSTQGFGKLFLKN